jgi:hypothetical protein
MKKLIGKITSPIFVPLRKFVAWGDDKFGTCDHKLMVVPREVESSEAVVEKVEVASELEKKLSKDRANLQGLGESESETADDNMVGC